ncbi:MAG: hypothetical protein IKK82_06825, partial [Kiritimatiellae bacterium]|nr:hypothetical protein [Kiritimatiellia bacterium]
CGAHHRLPHGLGHQPRVALLRHAQLDAGQRSGDDEGLPRMASTGVRWRRGGAAACMERLHRHL